MAWRETEAETPDGAWVKDFALQDLRREIPEVHIDPSIDDAARYLQKCAELGQLLGDIKPATLHAIHGWEGVFGG